MVSRPYVGTLFIPFRQRRNKRGNQAEGPAPAVGRSFAPKELLAPRGGYGGQAPKELLFRRRRFSDCEAALLRPGGSFARIHGLTGNPGHNAAWMPRGNQWQDAKPAIDNIEYSTSKPGGDFQGGRRRRGEASSRSPRAPRARAGGGPTTNEPSVAEARGPPRGRSLLGGRSPARPSEASGPRLFRDAGAQRKRGSRPKGGQPEGPPLRGGFAPSNPGQKAGGRSKSGVPPSAPRPDQKRRSRCPARGIFGQDGVHAGAA